MTEPQSMTSRTTSSSVKQLPLPGRGARPVETGTADRGSSLAGPGPRATPRGPRLPTSCACSDHSTQHLVLLGFPAGALQGGEEGKLDCPRPGAEASPGPPAV